MAGIGGTTCDFVHGGPPRRPKTRVVVWQVPGISGYGAMQLGEGDSEFLFTAVKHGTEAAVETWITAIEATQATIVSVVDDFGNTFANCLVVAIGKPRVTPAKHGSDTMRGEIAVAGVKLS